MFCKLSQIGSLNATFESVFNLEICSILSQYLSSYEIFLVLSGLNSNFNQIVRRLEKYEKIWVKKYLQEFGSKSDVIDEHFRDTEALKESMKALMSKYTDADYENDAFKMYQKMMAK